MSLWNGNKRQMQDRFRTIREGMASASDSNVSPISSRFVV